MKFYYYTTQEKIITFNECIFTSTRFKRKKTCFTFEKKNEIKKLKDEKM